MYEKDVKAIASLISDESFDMDPESIRQLGYQTVDLMVDYFKDIRSSSIRPCISLSELKELLWEPLPQGEQDPSTVLATCHEKIISHAVRLGHPHLLGWIVASGTVIGAFADGIAAALNQNVALAVVSAATTVELLVLDWIKQLIGYDPKALGLLVSGGSIANLIGLTVARNVKAGFDVQSYGLDQHDKGALILYASKEVHMCVPKAAHILGLGTENIRWIPVDSQYRLDSTHLEAQIKKDTKNGKKPFAVVATAGTVNTGAIDPLDTIADICKKYDLWFHVDAAYGGCAAISPRQKPLLQGINRADSVALDPHKWLYIPYEAGCVLVRNPTQMKKTFAMEAPYIHLQDTTSSNENDIDFSDYGLQLSRQFRALKIWMSLQQYGIQKYGRLIDQNIYLAQYLAALVKQSPDFEAATDPCLSIFCFRYYPQDLQEKYQSANHDEKQVINKYLNRLNQSLVEIMSHDSNVLLSTTTLGDTYVLRACIINYRTTKGDIEEILAVLRKCGRSADKNLR